MTIPAPISAELLRFLDANVSAIDDLEVLRILSEANDRSAEMSELTTQAQTTSVSVKRLEQRGLLNIVTTEAKVICHFAQMPPETENLLNQLLQLYRERPVTLIKIVYARDRKDLHAFADSFRLRKEP